MPLFLLLALLTVGGGAAAISADGLRDRVVDADLVIVPGNSVGADGRPSPRLRGRLDAALGYYRDGHARAILVSGGIGAEGFDEAAVMKDYLVAHGVRPDAVYTDNQGADSFATARHAAQLMHAKSMTRPVVASQFFHIPRMKLALEKHGLHAVGQVHSQQFEARDVYSTLREVAGYASYALRPQQPTPATTATNEGVE
jgi:vancomycin permeability regulator SanA